MQLFAFAAALLIVAAGALAQETRGEIQGTTKDPQGAVVPNVTITITGVDVGFTRTETTDSDGFYRSRELPPGIYRISAAATDQSFRLPSLFQAPRSIRFGFRFIF